MSSFHVTLKQGRSDSLTLEADNKSDILTFFNTVSTAVVSGIKKIVFTKDLSSSSLNVPFVSSPFYSEVLVFAKSETKSKVFRLYFVNKIVTKEILLNQFLKLYIDDEQITDIYNIQFIA